MGLCRYFDSVEFVSQSQLLKWSQHSQAYRPGWNGIRYYENSQMLRIRYSLFLLFNSLYYKFEVTFITYRPRPQEYEQVNQNMAQSTVATKFYIISMTVQCESWRNYCIVFIRIITFYRQSYTQAAYLDSSFQSINCRDGLRNPFILCSILLFSTFLFPYFQRSSNLSVCCMEYLSQL